MQEKKGHFTAHLMGYEGGPSGLKGKFLTTYYRQYIQLFVPDHYVRHPKPLNFSNCQIVIYFICFTT